MAARPLARLGRTNTTTAFLATAGLVVIALVFGSWIGALILAAICTLLTVILVRIWPALDAKGRAGRIAALTAVAGLAVLQLLR